VFVLVRTSNPSGDEIQNVEVRDGGTVAGKVAEMVARLGDEYSLDESMHSVGAVVGATKPEAAKQLRELMPRQPFLLPGFGAQGGGVEGVHAALDGSRGGVLVTSSRGIIYPPHTEVSPEGADPQDWGGRIKAAAQSFADTICSVVGGDQS
jgi:orotidine-5'-phosphate decarboxylase